MRNSASCGTLHHAELHMLFSAKDWKPLRKRVPILRKYAELCIGFPLLAEYWDKFSVTCGIGISAELRKMWNSNREFLASNIFHFLNLFHYIFRMMRKCCPNTPQEISASKLAENEGFCGNLRYGQNIPKFHHDSVHISRFLMYNFEQ